MRTALRVRDIPEQRGFAPVQLVINHPAFSPPNTLPLRRALLYWALAIAGIAFAVFVMSGAVDAAVLNLGGEKVAPVVIVEANGERTLFVELRDFARAVRGSAEFSSQTGVIAIRAENGSTARFLEGSRRYVVSSSSGEALLTGELSAPPRLRDGLVLFPEESAGEFLEEFQRLGEKKQEFVPAPREPVGAGNAAVYFPASSQKPPVVPSQAVVFPAPAASGKPDIPVAAPLRKAAPFIRNIVIDAGHGDQDAGAVGPGGTREKDVNLAVASALASELQPRVGGTIHLTRQSDVFLALKERVAFARKRDADLFISIHANSAPKGRASAEGAEVYFFSTPTDEDARRAEATENNGAFDPKAEGIDPVLWNLMLIGNVSESHRLAKSVSNSFPDKAGLKNRGVKSARFYVLHYGVVSNIPSILIELGFISHPAEEKKLADPKWQKEAGAAIAEAVASFLTELEKDYPNGEGWSR